MIQRIAFPLASLALVVTLLAFAIPFAPRVPEQGLDPSFAFAMNMAVAQGLRFGQHIIFTLGPYASTYTAMYHPATDALMLVGGGVLGLGYSACLLLMSRGRHWLSVLGVCLALAVLLSSRDAFLLSYPLAMCFALTRLTTPDWGRPALTGLLLTVISAPLGLLVIIKGSFALLCTALAAMASLYLWQTDRRLIPVLIGAPLVTMLGLWHHAGQRLTDIAPYFITQLPIISGFTEAMSWPGPALEIGLWCATSAGLVAGALHWPGIKGQRVFLLLALLFYLFILFKAGFVRHDMHVVIASDGLIITACLLLLHRPTRLTLASLMVLPLCWSTLDKQHPHPVDYSHLNNLRALYQDAAQGLLQRITTPQALEARYQGTLAALHTRFSLPLLPGTADLYSVNQAELFASENYWQPRPIFQSYSAYTAELAQTNARHLTSPQAPQHIFFAVEPIDNRLPALEDGPSWLEMMNRYDAIPSTSQGYVLLNKKTEAIANPYRPLASMSYRLGQMVEVPAENTLLFAQVDLEKSTAGTLRSLLFKSPPLMIDLELDTGEVRTFRFIEAMAQAPFLLSPAVLSTAGFTQLLGVRAAGAAPPARVQRFRLYSTQGHDSRPYRLHLSTASPPAPSEQAFDSNRQPSTRLSAQRLGALETTQCQGQIDRIDDHPPQDRQGSRQPLLRIQGWNTLSGEHGSVPEAVFIGLISPKGDVELFRASPMERPDVVAHFARADLLHAGFSAAIDTRDHQGAYTLTVMRIHQGRLESCELPRLMIDFHRS